MLWIILTGGNYIPPVDVRSPPCGQAGAVVGVQVDRLVNPTAVLWPDPLVAGRHCRIDVTATVAGLKPGEYHFATTIIGAGYTWPAKPAPYIPHDPHVSEFWTRQLGGITPPKPKSIRVEP